MSEDDLFASAPSTQEPLAARMRPQSLEDVVGQSHLLGPDQPLTKAIQSRDGLHSFLLWGPPGWARRRLLDSYPRKTMRCSCRFRLCSQG